MKTNIGLTVEQRRGSAGLLQTLLADEHVLYVKTRKYHWNVGGASFSELHKFFEEQYTQIETIIDEVAERSLSIGEPVAATLGEFAKLGRVAESADESPDSKGMIANLLEAHETIIRHLRDDLKKADDTFDDMGTSDFLTGVMEQHEKMAWMLRRYLG
jgi:starvation-inducible DNA-binding protein